MSKLDKFLEQEKMLNEIAATNARFYSDNSALNELGKAAKLMAISSASNLMNDKLMGLNSALSVAQTMNIKNNIVGMDNMIQNIMHVNSAICAREYVEKQMLLEDTISMYKGALLDKYAWNDLNDIANSIRITYEDNVFRAMLESMRTRNKMFEQFKSQWIANNMRWQSMMKEYQKLFMRSELKLAREVNKIVNLTNSARNIAEMWEIANKNNFAQRHWLENEKYLSEITSFALRYYEDREMLKNLCVVVENQIDSSIWEYKDILDDGEDDYTREEFDEVLNVVNSFNLVSNIEDYISKYGERGKLLLVQVIRWIILAFFAGLIGHISEPIYRTITPSFIRQEAMDSASVEKIPVNTEIHIWSDVTKNYISVTYNINDEEHSGYITREELENNTEKISNEVKLEHVIFIDDVVKYFAKSWTVNSEDVYNFLNAETNLLDSYLLEHYEVLKELDNAERLKMFEKYCNDKDIDIKGYFLKKEREDKTITLKSIVDNK